MGRVKIDEVNMKRLRQGIMAAASKRGWNYDTMHKLMQEWGYGNSLRALLLPQLIELRRLVTGEEQRIESFDNYRMSELDEQGKYMWNLMKKAGWNWKQVRQYMIKRFKKTHWNCLNRQEKRAIISMLKNYSK